MEASTNGFVRLVRPIASLLVVLATTPAAAFDVVTNFQRVGTSTFEGFAPCGFATTSPFGGNSLRASPAGLGHVGGASDDLIDPGESVEFFRGAARRGAAYRVLSASNQDGDGVPGETLVEAFAGEISLGVLPSGGVGEIDVDALFGGAAISRYIVTALETIRIGSAQWRLRPGDFVHVYVGVTVGASYTVASPMLQCGVQIDTEDGSLHVDSGSNALGIIGGASDRVDAGESMLVSLGEPMHELSYYITDSTNVGGTAAPGDHFVEAFDANGTPLGLRSASDTGVVSIDLTALYGVPIRAFELIGVSDSFRLQSVRIVPEPGSGLGFAAIGALAWAARRRRVHATPTTSR